MSRQYYYLVASLPGLKKGEKAPFTGEEFLKTLEGQLSEMDYQLLKRISIEMRADEVEAMPSEGAAGRFLAFEASLRAYLAEARGAALKRKADKVLSNIPRVPETSLLAQQVFKTDSPAEAEEILFSARWDFLSDMKSGHFFDLDIIIIYYLQLLLLNKKNKQNKADGEQVYSRIYSSIVGDRKQQQIHYGE